MTKRATVLASLAITLIALALPVTVGAQIAGEIQFVRPYDQSGVSVFEAPGTTNVAFSGMKVKWGAAFTQQLQSLSHSNTGGGLVDIGSGFNTATANLNLDVQLSDGIRVNVITYMSSRHHPEAWVKGGYLQADKLVFFNNASIDNLMEYLTIRAGHFEINYGDSH